MEVFSWKERLKVVKVTMGIVRTCCSVFEGQSIVSPPSSGRSCFLSWNGECGGIQAPRTCIWDGKFDTCKPPNQNDVLLLKKKNPIESTWSGLWLYLHWSCFYRTIGYSLKHLHKEGFPFAFGMGRNRSVLRSACVESHYHESISRKNPRFWIFFVFSWLFLTPLNKIFHWLFVHWASNFICKYRVACLLMHSSNTWGSTRCL